MSKEPESIMDRMNEKMKKIIDVVINKPQTHCVCGKEIDPEDHWVRLGKKWCSEKCAKEALLTEEEQETFMRALLQPSVLINEEITIPIICDDRIPKDEIYVTYEKDTDKVLKQKEKLEKLGELSRIINIKTKE